MAKFNSSNAKKNVESSQQKIMKKLGSWTMPANAILVLLVVSLGSWLFIWPKVQEIRDIQDKTTAQKAYNEKLAAGEKKLSDFVESYKTYKNNYTEGFNSIDRILPPDPDVPGLIVGAQSLAQEMGNLPFNEVVVEEGKKSELKVNIKNNCDKSSGKPCGAPVWVNVPTVPYKIVFNGRVGYTDYREALRTLANNERLMDLDKINFGGEEASAAAGQKDAGKGLNFELRTYYYPQPVTKDKK